MDPRQKWEFELSDVVKLCIAKGTAKLTKDRRIVPVSSPIEAATPLRYPSIVGYVRSWDREGIYLTPFDGSFQAPNGFQIHIDVVVSYEILKPAGPKK